jgi:hypothetical protein
MGGIGLSTNCPSPTPFGLGLGPGLPWADEPSPGILRFTAKRILTSFLAYSYRHSHFYSLHHTSQYDFYANRTLPYHSRSKIPETRCKIIAFASFDVTYITFSLSVHTRFLVLHRYFVLYTLGLWQTQLIS